MRFLLDPLPTHQLKAAVWVVKLDCCDARTQETLSVLLCVFLACMMNHVYIQNSSPGDPSSVSYYTQGYTEKEPLCLNDISYFNMDRAP